MKAHKKQRTLTQHIPSDNINDILLGLPVKSLVRFRYVCKPWNYLITSPRFISMHLHRATKDSYGNHNKVILSSDNIFQSLDYEASSAKIEQLDFPLEAHGLEVVGSCNGLLCIVIHNRGFVLWNPSIREYKEIPFPVSPRNFSFIYGFGYNSAIDDYEVIICIWGGKIKGIQIGIYTLKSNSFTRVGTGPYFLRCQFAGTLVNEALYWFVLHDDHKKIFRFDLRDDTCILIQLPPRDVLKHYFIIKLGDFGESLCMFVIDDGYGIKMWTLKEHSYEKIWIELMTISLWEEMPSRGYLVPVCCTKNCEILVKNKEVIEKFYLYNTKEKPKFRELDCNGRYFEGLTYVESLVSPNSNGVKLWCK